MAVAFGTKAFTVVSSAATVTPAEPSGAAAGETLFYWHVFDAHTAPSTFTSGPTGGWNLLNTWTGTNTQQCRLYWLRRGSAAPGFTSTISQSAYQEACVSRWTGCETNATPVNVAVYNSPTTRTPCIPDCPSATPTVPNTIAIAFGMGWTGAGTGGWTAPSGYSAVTLNDGTSQDLCAAYKALTGLTAENPAAYANPFNNVGNDVAEATVIIMPPDLVAIPKWDRFPKFLLRR